MSEQPDQAEDGAGGVCNSCGRALPAPDLEAVAASIDHTLSLETGKMVPRTAWAGSPPDGAMDALFSWLPSVKAKRALWERGQQLWTEQMTAALAGPCDDCRAAGVDMGAGMDSGADPGMTAAIMMDPVGPGGPGGPPEASLDRTVVAPQTGYDPSTTAMPTAAMEAFSPSSAPERPEEGATTAMPAWSEPPARPDSTEYPTAAVSSFGSSFGAPPPAEAAETAFAESASAKPAGDEHESHTMILSSMPSLRTTTRLVALEGPVHGRQFSLGRQLTTIGRSIGCHVTVEDDSVSYDHARIVRTPEGWQVELLGSARELFVNDEPVREPRALRNGDVIRIGPARLRFESTSQAS